MARKGNIIAFLLFCLFFKSHSEAVQDNLAKGSQYAVGVSQFGVLSFPSIIQIVLQAVTSASCDSHSASHRCLPAKVMRIFQDSSCQSTVASIATFGPSWLPHWHNPILRLTTVHLALVINVHVHAEHLCAPRVNQISDLSLTPSSCSINVYLWVKFERIFSKKTIKIQMLLMDFISGSIFIRTFSKTT